MDKPLVTISISIYNNIDGLEKSVNSIVNQTYDNIEIIISDDGSTKYDTNELNKYADIMRKRFESVRVNINSENIGTVKHLNKLISMSNGKYYCDVSPGDTIYHKDVIKNVVSRFEKTGWLIITSKRADEYDDGSKKVRPGSWVGLALKFCPRWLLNYMLNKRNVLSGCGTYYSRALFEKHGKFDEQYKLVEDFTYFVKILSNGERVGWINDVTSGHEMGGVSNGDVHPLVYQDIELLKKNYNAK